MNTTHPLQAAAATLPTGPSAEPNPAMPPPAAPHPVPASSTRVDDAPTGAAQTQEPAQPSTQERMLAQTVVLEQMLQQILQQQQNRAQMYELRAAEAERRRDFNDQKNTMDRGVAIMGVIVVDCVAGVQNIKGAAPNPYTESGVRMVISVVIAALIVLTFGESAKQVVGGSRTIGPRLGEMLRMIVRRLGALQGGPNPAPNGVDVFPFVFIVLLSLLNLSIGVIFAANRPTVLALISCLPPLVSFGVLAIISYYCW